MTSETSRKAYKGLLTFLGFVPVVVGSATVLLGVDSVPGADEASATVDSEMRFYAVWYVGTGVVLLWSARNLERAGTLIRGIAVLLFVAGLSRLLSWAMVGAPHRAAQVLMVIELVLPWVIVSWQVAIERSLRGGDPTSSHSSGEENSGWTVEPPE